MKSRMGAILAGAVVSAAAAFFVIAVASNNWFVDGNNRTGLWSVCPSGEADADCQKIGLSDCKANFLGNNVDVTGGNCSQFNGIRALAILAMIFGILAGFCLLILTAFCSMVWGRRHGLAFGLLAGVFGLAAMAVAVDFNNVKLMGSKTGYGYSFGLLTAGWLMMLGGTAYAGYASAGDTQ